jgi:hypothetical protein
LTPKVEDQEHPTFSLQLLASKVDDQEPNTLGFQLLAPNHFKSFLIIEEMKCKIWDITFVKYLKM